MEFKEACSIERDCPKCGGEVHVAKYRPDQTSAQCDTSVEECMECEWKGEPQ